MTNTGKQIAITAWDYLKSGCKESPNTPNRSSCVDAIQARFGLKGQFWCAMFAWSVLDDALKHLDAQNPVAKNALSCKLIFEATKPPLKPLRIDQTPAVGSLFFRDNSTTVGACSQGSTNVNGHAGVVVWVDKDVFITIEGNLDDKVGAYYYNFPEIRTRNFAFLHTEEIPTSKPADNVDIAVLVRDVVAKSQRKGAVKLSMLDSLKEAVQENPATTIAAVAGITILLYFLTKK